MSEPLHPEVALFNAALELPMEERAAYLGNACGGDAALRAQVEALLDAHDRADAFLEKPFSGLDDGGSWRSGALLPERPGDRIGRYKLIEVIGEGGCGVVYLAEQEQPVRRRVAVKVIKLGMDTRQVVARFEAERQALALMDHPGIARVLDGGATETGRPYFVMELVPGVKITEYCDRHGASIQDRISLFIQVCQAIQHAHQKGVIHRDVKPSNILVLTTEAGPVPKVIDFGIAKAAQGRLVDRTIFTAVEQFMGTPAYMSPEQAVVTSQDIDTRSDIYSLGVLLYELLTGCTPFDQQELITSGLDEMRRTIREKEPAKPSTRVTHQLAGGRAGGRGVETPRPARSSSARPWQPSKELIRVLRGDLDWIVMKCLEKDRSRRYETANGLASDLQRHLDHEPVMARPPTQFYRFRKLVRRNKVTFAAASVLVVALILVAVGASLAAWRVSGARRAELEEREKAETANRQLRQTVNLLELGRAEERFEARDAAAGVAHLAAMLRRDPSNHLAASRLVSALLHRNWALPAAGARRHLGPVTAASFSPDGRFVLSASRDGSAIVADADTGVACAVVQHQGRVLGASFGPDGRRMVTASADRTARVWDAATGRPVTPPLAHTGRVHWAEFSADGGRIVTASGDRTARVWDAATGELKHELRAHTSPVVLARFSPDAKRIVTGGAAASVRMWDAESGAMLFRVEDRVKPLTALAFSPDGRRLLSACVDGVARLWEAADGRPVGRPLEHRTAIESAIFSPDGRLVLTCSQDNTARLWEAATGVPVGLPFVHEGGVVCGVFSPDGLTLATGSMDNSARLWDVATGAALCQPLRQYEGIFAVGFSPDGRRLVAGSYDWSVQIWDIRPRRGNEIELRARGNASSVAFSRDGEFVLAGFEDATAGLLDTRTARPRFDPIRHSGPVRKAAFSPDGGRFVTASASRSAYVRDSVTGVVKAGPFQHRRGLWFVQFSPDGERVVTASADGTARVWDVRSGAAVTPPLEHKGEVRVAQFSPDGQRVVTASDDDTARVWEAGTGRPVTESLAHLDQVKWVEFSPDGRKVVTASADNTACIWDARTGKRTAPPLQHTRIVHKAVFSPDGRRVATASLDRTARIWDAASGQAVSPPLADTSPLTELCYSADGRRLVTGSGDGRARVWDAETGRPLTESLVVGSYVTSAGFDSASRRLVIGAQGVRIWGLPSAPTPVPEWFPAFAEGVAGIRLDDRGSVALVPRLELERRPRQVSPGGAGAYYERLAEWFLEDPVSRSRDPF